MKIMCVYGSGIYMRESLYVYVDGDNVQVTGK